MSSTTHARISRNPSRFCFDSTYPQDQIDFEIGAMLADEVLQHACNWAPHRLAYHLHAYIASSQPEELRGFIAAIGHALAGRQIRPAGLRLRLDARQEGCLYHAQTFDTMGPNAWCNFRPAGVR